MGLILRLFRFTVYAILSWLALAALWLGLPSPSREYSSHPGRYARNTLRSGTSLVRVYDTKEWNRNGFPVEYTGGEARHSFALSYKLEQKRNTTLLTMRDGLTIDLSPLYITSYPFVSQEKYTLAITGDQDGINPPWFAKADSTLLFWWIHRDSAKVALKIRWRDANNVEIWPASAEITGVNEPEDREPFLRLSFETPPENQGNRVSFLNDVRTASQSSSPSATYAIRVMILAIIAPTGLLVLGLITVLGPVVEFCWDVAVITVTALGLYCAFVLIVWVARGKMPLSEDDFVSRLPGMELFGGRGATRTNSRRRRTVWGASGPIEVEDEEDRRVCRRPLRSVADFFRSSAPLDDLLASFDSTRRFTEPMGWKYRSEARESLHSTRTPSNEDDGRQRQTYSKDGQEQSGLIDLEKALPEKPRIVLQR